MSNEKNNRNLFVGTAVLAGLLGTLSALVRSNSTVNDWKEQAKGAAARFVQREHPVNKNMLLGGVAAGLIGAAAALLFAPKSGAELFRDLIHSNSQEDSAEGASHKHPAAKQKRKTKGSNKKEAQTGLKEPLKEPRKAKKMTAKAGKIKSSPHEKKLTRRPRSKPSAQMPTALLEEPKLHREVEAS